MPNRAALCNNRRPLGSPAESAIVFRWLLVLVMLPLLAACPDAPPAASATCVDGMLNGTETDIDCGPGCSPCAAGGSCASGPDCASGVCDNGACAAPLPLDCEPGESRCIGRIIETCDAGAWTRSTLCGPTESCSEMMDGGVDAACVPAYADACRAQDSVRGWLSSTEVDLATGIVRGEVVNSDGPNTVTRFRGIPYAESTAGNNRWRPPVPAMCITDGVSVFDADTFAPNCRQDNPNSLSRGDEDCLAVNVFAPTQAAAGSNLPVMVWLHGGGMWYGSGDALPGPAFASYGVVSVSFNSRVGPLGYIAHPVFADESPTGAAAGNYGLMDVIEALQWVQANISAFGGDPNNVTVIGVSGGGDRVYYLMASPQAEGLFHKASAHSGSTWIFQEPQRVARAAETMAEHLGCGDVETGQPLKDCLRNAPASALDDFPWQQGDGFFYSNVDGYMLPGRLEDVFGSGDFNHVPFISVSNAEDRARFVPYDIADAFGDLGGNGTVGDAEDWDAFIALYHDRYAAALQGAYPFADLAATYLGQRHGGMFAAFQAFQTDYFFNCAHRRIADIIADNQDEPVWFVSYEDCPDDGTLPSTCDRGAGHGVELELMFLDTGRNQSEALLRQYLLVHWYNFFANGDPNDDDTAFWPEYDAADRWTMVFDSDGPDIDDHSLGTGVYEQAQQRVVNARCDVWDSIWDAHGMVAGEYLDLDGDGVIDRLDNCMTGANGDQLDADGNGVGDACE